MDSELLTCLLKFIEYFPDYLSALSRTLLRFFWTTFVETAVCVCTFLVGDELRTPQGNQLVLHNTMEKYPFIMQEIF